LVNDLSSVWGVSSFCALTFLLPLLTSGGVRQYTVVFFGLTAMLAHFVAYATVTDPMLFLVLQPLGTGDVLAGIACSGIISGLPSLGSVQYKDQGTLLGTLSGVKMVFTFMAPFGMAACTTSWRSFPAPFNVPGIGFWLCTLLILPTVPLSAYLCFKGPRQPSKCATDAQVMSLGDDHNEVMWDFLNTAKEVQPTSVAGSDNGPTDPYGPESAL
jgi:hypothetical protein